MTTIPAASSRRVVVGYDGSPGSHAALERAVDAAGHNGIVFVVHAYPRPRSWFGAPNHQERLDAALADAESTVRRLCEETGGPLDHVAWEPEVVPGDPAEVIAAVAEARHADEIVVGSRRLGFASALLGSVAQNVIRTARVPVTVIPRGVAPRADAA